MQQLQKFKTLAIAEKNISMVPHFLRIAKNRVAIKQNRKYERLARKHTSKNKFFIKKLMKENMIAHVQVHMSLMQILIIQSQPIKTK